MSDTAIPDPAELVLILKQRSLEVDEPQFRREQGGHYLFGQMQATTEDDWSFVTDVRMPEQGAGWDSILQRSSSGSGERLLWKVEKTNRNAWKRRISVGRATNNDIIIRHHSISKLHAHFHFGTLVKLLRLSPSANLLLSDVGSANGSSVDGRPLAEGDTVPVSTGIRIVFGDVRCELLDAKSLYSVLRSTLL